MKTAPKAQSLGGSHNHLVHFKHNYTILTYRATLIHPKRNHPTLSIPNPSTLAFPSALFHSTLSIGPIYPD